jgi:hypothetical protein
VGGLIFGSTIKPTRFDKPGDKPAAGSIEMINWHAIGGISTCDRRAGEQLLMVLGKPSPLEMP